MVYSSTPMQEGPSLTLTPDYIVGLVDGEGSFTFHLNTHPSRRNRIELRFYLKLRKEDKDILDALKCFFRCGNVYVQRDRRPRHTDCYRYEVGAIKSLREVIIPFFQRFPLKSPSKLRDFTAFCKAMEVVEEKNHFTEEGIKKLTSLKKIMH